VGVWNLAGKFTQNHEYPEKTTQSHQSANVMIVVATKISTQAAQLYTAFKLTIIDIL
jgi:hypothetical protein